MGAKVLRWLLSCTGYLLYTLVVLICLLWFLFPADTVKGWIVQGLDARYPDYSWSIGSLGLVLSGGLEMTGVKITPADAKSTPLIVERIAFFPDIPQLLHKKKALKYSLEMLDGTVNGRAVLADGTQFNGTGMIEGLQLAKLEILQQSLQRTVDGTLSGNFSCSGSWDTLSAVQGKGDFTLADGTLHFKAPVLGLQELSYASIESNVYFSQGLWKFDQGKLQSAWMNGIFSGSLQSGISLAASQLEFKGTLEPRSEMFAGVDNKQMAQVVRRHLKDGGLPFTVNGTAGEPGILFSGPLSLALKSLTGSTK